MAWLSAFPASSGRSPLSSMSGFAGLGTDWAPQVFGSGLAPQMVANHSANIYAHLDVSDLETALRALNEEPG